jgi:hypothetical protein
VCLEAVAGIGQETIREATKRPTLLPWYSANHSAPSGPVVMLWGPLPSEGIVNSVTAPGGSDPADFVANDALSLPSVTHRNRDRRSAA